LELQHCCARTIKTRAATLFAVPLILALLSAIQHFVHQAATDYIILPPFAVIVYLIFQYPSGRSTRIRSIVVLPTLAAIAGQIAHHYLGFTPQGVVAVTLVVLALQALLRADMPPALAIAVLAMLLHTESPTYVLGVFEGTVITLVVFRVWLRFAPRTP
jgi:hypothetical protein